MRSRSERTSAIPSEGRALRCGSKLVVISLRLAPIAMDGGDERFGFLDGERTGRSFLRILALLRPSVGSGS